MTRTAIGVPGRISRETQDVGDILGPTGGTLVHE